MILVDGEVLLPLDVVDSLEKGESVADAGNAQLFEILVLHFDQGGAVYRFLCDVTTASVYEFWYKHYSPSSSSLDKRENIPTNNPAYLLRPRADIQSAH